MSRIYDALQRSQGDNPNSSPLATPTQAEPESQNLADAYSTQVPAEDALKGAIPESAAEPHEVPPMRARTGELRTEALQAGALSPAPSAASWLDVPLERVLHPRPSPEQRLVTIAAPNSAGAEVFRVLSTRLAHMQNKRELRKLLITSSVGEEGKSVVAVNLAVSLSRRAGEKTLLIEADLRRPTASTLFTSSKLRGITDWNAGKASLDSLFYRVSDMPLWFLSAGAAMEEPLPLLESDRFAQMLQAASAPFDWVILDATPMLPMADSTSLSRLSDGVLVVVREGHTRRKVLSKALETIEPSKMLGIVLNEASMLQVGYDRYYGGYGENQLMKNAREQELEHVNAASA